MRSGKSNLRLKDAVKVKQAEMWLKAGQPLNAVRGLQQLPAHAWNHPWTEQVVWRAARELGTLGFGSEQPSGLVA